MTKLRLWRLSCSTQNSYLKKRSTKFRAVNFVVAVYDTPKGWKHWLILVPSLTIGWIGAVLVGPIVFGGFIEYDVALNRVPLRSRRRNRQWRNQSANE